MATKQQPSTPAKRTKDTPLSNILATGEFATEQLASDADSSSLPVILLLGYWPPTGTDYMMSDYEKPQNVNGYSVHAYSTKFDSPLGWATGVSPLLPQWGKGDAKSAFLVDYRGTATFFWKTVERLNPVAIMSFSRGLVGVSWVLEKNTWNYNNNQWNLNQGGNTYQTDSVPGNQAYPPPRPSATPQGTTHPAPTIDAPFIGGSPHDPSPYGGTVNPVPDNGPPDPKQAGVNWNNGSPGGSTFQYKMPMDNTIVTDINNANIKTSPSVTPPNNSVPAINAIINDKAGGLGNYVSGFMALLVCWYGNDTGVQPENAAIKCYGHTHVGTDIDNASAKSALTIQLNDLITYLQNNH